MEKPKTLDDAVRNNLNEMIKSAFLDIKNGDLQSAISIGDNIFESIPEPKYGWDYSYILLECMVEILRSTGQYGKAFELVNKYISSPYYLDYEDGPYFWLGTLYFEKSEFSEAYENFQRANKISRGRCFVEEDPKYKAFYKTFVVSRKIH